MIGGVGGGKNRDGWNNGSASIDAVVLVLLTRCFRLTPSPSSSMRPSGLRLRSIISAIYNPDFGDFARRKIKQTQSRHITLLEWETWHWSHVLYLLRTRQQWAIKVVEKSIEKSSRWSCARSSSSWPRPSPPPSPTTATRCLVCLYSRCIFLPFAQGYIVSSWKVLRVTVADEATGHFLHDLGDTLKLDFWNELRVNAPADVMVSPQNLDRLTFALGVFACCVF